MRHADVEGNVKTLFFPQEDDSTYNKCVRTESGYLAIDLKEKQEVEKIKMWPEVTGTVIPLFKAKNSQLRLEEYQWFDDLRPKEPYDVMNIPSGMAAMISLPYERYNEDEDKYEEIGGGKENPQSQKATESARNPSLKPSEAASKDSSKDKKSSSKDSKKTGSDSKKKSSSKDKKAEKKTSKKK